MAFKIALSNHAGHSSRDDIPQAGELWAQLWGSKKFKGILTSAAICLAVATVAALSDFRNSVFSNMGAEGKFSDESSKPRPEALASTASPDRGGSNSWSLDYLVEANASFIRAAKQKMVQLIVKVPPITPAPAAAPANPGVGAPGGAYPQRAGVPQALDSVLSAMKQVNVKRPAISTPLPAPSRNFNSSPSQSKPIVGVLVTNTTAAQARPAPVAQAASSHRPTARPVVGARYMSGASSSGTGKTQRDRNYSYSPGQ